MVEKEIYGPKNRDMQMSRKLESSPQIEAWCIENEKNREKEYLEYVKEEHRKRLERSMIFTCEYCGKEDLYLTLKNTIHQSKNPKHWFTCRHCGEMDSRVNQDYIPPKTKEEYKWKSEKRWCERCTNCFYVSHLEKKGVFCKKCRLKDSDVKKIFDDFQEIKCKLIDKGVDCKFIEDTFTKLGPKRFLKLGLEFFISEKKRCEKKEEVLTRVILDADLTTIGGI
jgi:DNA-directed RNA polymerase subunit M/transcription elongation factor TFIIS